VRAAGAILAIAVALVAQTTLARFVIRGVVAIDLVLVVVVYLALTSGPAAGLLAGAVGGLVQDALSTGVIGVGGLAKTVVGFVVGLLGTHFIVTRSLPRFVVFAGATGLHATVFFGLYAVLDLQRFGSPYLAVAGQAAGNAVVGVLAFELAELLPGALERRRAVRARPRR
jgi:rod shape-determining protein MreD